MPYLNSYAIAEKLNIQNKVSVLKATREKTQVTYKDRPIRLNADFSMETLKARRAWKDVFQSLKNQNCQSSPICLAKLSTVIDGEKKFL